MPYVCVVYYCLFCNIFFKSSKVIELLVKAMLGSHVLVRKYVDVRMIFSTGDDMLLHTYKHFTANSTSVSMYVKPIKRACTRTGQRTYVVQEVE